MASGAVQPTGLASRAGGGPQPSAASTAVEMVALDSRTVPMLVRALFETVKAFDADRDHCRIADRLRRSRRPGTERQLDERVLDLVEVVVCEGEPGGADPPVTWSASAGRRSRGHARPAEHPGNGDSATWSRGAAMGRRRSRSGQVRLQRGRREMGEVDVPAPPVPAVPSAPAARRRTCRSAGRPAAGCSR